VCALNVSGRCFDIWPDDGSFEQKNVAEFLILITIYIYIYIYIVVGDRGSTVVKVLCYKSEGL